MRFGAKRQEKNSTFCDQTEKIKHTFDLSQIPEKNKTHFLSFSLRGGFNFNSLVLKSPESLKTNDYLIGTGAVSLSPRSAGDSSMFPKRPIWCALIRRRFSQKSVSPLSGDASNAYIV